MDAFLSRLLALCDWAMPMPRGVLVVLLLGFVLGALSILLVITPINKNILQRFYPQLINHNASLNAAKVGVGILGVVSAIALFIVYSLVNRMEDIQSFTTYGRAPVIFWVRLLFMSAFSFETIIGVTILRKLINSVRKKSQKSDIFPHTQTREKSQNHPSNPA